MGISAYIIWAKGIKKRNVWFALTVFGLQLALNLLWSFLFFGLRSTLYGLIDIIALWLAIAMTIVAFYKISRNAAFVMIPYLAWMTFAMVSNFFLWRLN